MERGTVEVAPLAFMRGRTLNDTFIILDEAQNTTPEQMQMFLTRLGFGSKVVVTGDVTQVDLPRDQASGLIQVRDILSSIDGIGFVGSPTRTSSGTSSCSGSSRRTSSTPRRRAPPASGRCRWSRSRSRIGVGRTWTRPRRSSSPGACSRRGDRRRRARAHVRAAEESRALKQEHLGIDEATDVLSFPLDGRDELPEGMPRALGDLVICPQVVGDAWRHRSTRAPAPARLRPRRRDGGAGAGARMIRLDGLAFRHSSPAQAAGWAPPTPGPSRRTARMWSCTTRGSRPTGAAATPAFADAVVAEIEAAGGTAVAT